MEGVAILCMLLVDECNTVSHIPEIGSINIFPEEKIECVVMDPPSFDFFQPVLSGGTSSNIKIFKGIPLLSYTMGRCEKIFQFLEAVDQEKPIVLSEGIGT